MRSNILHRTKSILCQKLRKKGILFIVLLNILYLISFLVVDCEVVGGRENVNFTGYLICAFSEQHFLTFAVFLSIIVGVNEIYGQRMMEVLNYRTRNAWTKAMLFSSAMYSVLYVFFLLCIMLLLAFVSGIDFSDLQTSCEGMDWFIPHILNGSEQVNVLMLAVVNAGNVVCYCITIATLYGFILSIVKRRTITILIAMIVGIIELVAVKAVMRWSYPFIPLGNVMLSMSYDRWNDSVNWMYWMITNVLLIMGTFYINRRREFGYDL